MEFNERKITSCGCSNPVTYLKRIVARAREYGFARATINGLKIICRDDDGFWFTVTTSKGVYKGNYGQSKMLFYEILEK